MVELANVYINILITSLILIFINWLCADFFTTCPASFQENVFKFSEKYEDEIGFGKRSKQMKELVIKDDILKFYKIYDEIYEQFKYFDSIMDHEPFFNDGLKMLDKIKDD